MGRFSKGDLVMIPQKVAVVNFNDGSGYVSNYVEMKNPTLAIFLEANDSSPSTSKVLIGTEEWYVNTDSISKGENYVGKINRSL